MTDYEIFWYILIPIAVIGNGGLWFLIIRDIIRERRWK